jgi:hypothetical protein
MKTPGRRGLRVRAGERQRKRQRRLTQKLSRDFPQLDLEVYRLPDGEWIVASSGEPLTEEEAIKILVAYRVVQRLMAQHHE